MFHESHEEPAFPGRPARRAVSVAAACFTIVRLSIRRTLERVKFDRASVLAGVRDGLPIAISAIPFGLIVGVTGVQSGLSVFQAASMPIIVYAGASQIAALQLFSAVAPLLVIWVTTTLINIRFVIYSATLAPHLAHLSVPWRLLLAYATTDQVFGLAVTRFRSEPRLKSPGAYFLLLTAVLGRLDGSRCRRCHHGCGPARRMAPGLRHSPHFHGHARHFLEERRGLGCRGDSRNGGGRGPGPAVQLGSHSRHAGR